MNQSLDSQKQGKIAIVHDALCVSGGAERVALWMSKVFPEAPIYTSVYLPDQTFPEFRQKTIKTLPFSNLIKSEKQFKLMYLLWLFELRKIDFSEYDIVLSSSTYLAKYIQPCADVVHKAYIHAPFRLFWKPDSYSSDSLPTPKVGTFLVKALIPIFRKWDQKNTRKLSSIATNSENMKKEISRVYQKTATVIYPPVDIDDYPFSDSIGDYYLTVSRLISHKRVDIAIEACTRLKKNLIIVGDGPERKKLEQMAGDLIIFKGRVADSELKQLYLDSKALIFPSYEDFGIVPVEAQACGRPVIAFGKGGVLETVEKGETGIFFTEQTTESLIKGISEFEKWNYSPSRIRDWSQRFDKVNFFSALNKFVEK